VTELALTLRTPPKLRVDMRGVTPVALAALDAGAIAKHAVWHGNEKLALGELFAIKRKERHDDTPSLRLAGDLARFDRIGWMLDGGHLHVEGAAGDYLGALMTGGTLECSGDAAMFAGCEMAGGSLHVGGSVGDFAGATQAGSMDGMRGGVFIVHGDAGERLGDRMRRGLLAVFGNAGDCAASRMVAGTIAIGGKLGAQPAFGMRRGTLVLAYAAPHLPPTFVRTTHDITVFWRLLARQIAALGGAFAEMGSRSPTRLVGDLAVDGKGEVLFFK